MLVKLHSLLGNQLKEIDISDDIYGVSSINQVAIAQVVRWQLHKKAGFRSSTKTRSDVRGSGKKIYRQKGTGNARHADKYAPQFRKGGVVHGPKAVQWSMSVPKKIKFMALKHVLSIKAQSGKLVIIDSLHIDSIGTKNVLDKFTAYRGIKTLFIDSQDKNSFFIKSIANVVNFNYLSVVGLNVFDILRSDTIVIAKDALGLIEKRFNL